MRVLLATPHGRDFAPEWIQSMLNLAFNPLLGIELSVTLRQGLYVHDNRNWCFFRARDNNFDCLLFVDSDIMFSVQDVLKVLQSPYSLSTGVYLNRWSGFPSLYRWHPGSNKRKMDGVQMSELNGEPLKVDVCGAGFLAIHRPVLDAYTDNKVKQLGNPFDFILEGEDSSFCYRMSQMGIPIYAIPDVRLIHMGICGYDARGEGSIQILTDTEG